MTHLKVQGSEYQKNNRDLKDDYPRMHSVSIYGNFFKLGLRPYIITAFKTPITILVTPTYMIQVRPTPVCDNLQNQPICYPFVIVVVETQNRSNLRRNR